MIEVNLTFIEVHSDEGKRAVMPPAVFADVDALHEAHVGLEEHVRRFTCVGVDAGPRSEDTAIAAVAVEIGDLRRLDGAGYGEMVNGKLLIADHDGDTTRNRPGRNMVPSPGPRRPQEIGAESGPRYRSGAAQELTAG